MLNRYQNLHLIQQLDPEKDCWQICHLMLGYEFPWDTIRSLEVALMRTYCLPKSDFFIDHPTRTSPNGYEIAKLGPQ